MAELKQTALSFRQHKLLLNKSYQKLHRYIVEQCIESLQGHRTHMIGLFKDIVIDCHRDKLMTSLLNYFRDEEPEYLHYLQVLDSAVVNLGRSIPPVWEPFPALITPNPIASLPECIPVFAPDVTNLPQKEQSACMDDEHIPSSEVILDPPVPPSCQEHNPDSESEITKLSQKEQSKCMDDHEHIPSHEVVSVPPVSPTCSEHILESEVTNLLQEEQSMCMDHEHIPSSEVILDPSVSPSCPEICSDPHRYTSQNYHDQQTIHLHQCAIQLCIDNLSADQMSKHVHDDEYDNHSSDYETLIKQLQPCSVGAQSLISDQLMCLNYSARDPSNIDSVNDSGMLVSQNLPGG